jgi:hypothetical protein
LAELLKHANDSIRLAAASIMLRQCLAYRDGVDLADRIEPIEKPSAARQSAGWRP